MKYIFPKFILLSLIFLCLNTFASAQNEQFNQADSLFANKKYTEAFKVYDQIFSEGLASQAMLMKMAFIKEGLGSYAEALYYLNLYYNQTSDKAALTKMRAIAEQHALSGYEYSDFQFFINFLHKFQLELTGALLAISLLILAYSYRSRKRGERPVTGVVLQLVVVLSMGILINGFIFKEAAIVATDNVVLMSGPSAAAEPVNVIEKGHRVEVLKEGPVWVRILWDNEPVYVRSKNLRTL